MSKKERIKSLEMAVQQLEHQMACLVARIDLLTKSESTVIAAPNHTPLNNMAPQAGTYTQPHIGAPKFGPDIFLNTKDESK